MAKTFPFLSSSKNGITLSVTLAPRSSKNKIVGEHNGRLKIAVTAPPVDGKANEALIDFLAKSLKIAKGSISITQGETSKQKKILIVGLSPESVEKIIS